MEKALDNIPIDNIQSQKGHSIWQKSNQAGQHFWGVDHFCGLAKTTPKRDCDLTALEWDGNEVRIGIASSISDMIIHALGIILAWKEQMESDYADVPFDVLLSIDYGEEDVAPSATLRFWAVRNQKHYVIPSAAVLEEFSQPVLMEQVNLK